MTMENIKVTYSTSSWCDEVESYVEGVDLGLLESPGLRKSISNLLHMFASHLMEWRDVTDEHPEPLQEVLLVLLLPSGDEVICSGYRDADGWHHRYASDAEVMVTGWRPIYVEL